MSLAAPNPPESAAPPRWIPLAVWLCSLLTVLHPLAGDDLWWELARGRALTEGYGNPSATLVAGPVGPDATWLGGVVPYLLFSGMGASGLMLGKLAGALALAGLLLKRGWDTSPFWGVIAAATVLAARGAGDSGPIFWDALGLVVVDLASSRTSPAPFVRKVLTLALLVAIWSNLGPRSVLAIPLVLSKGRLGSAHPLKPLVVAATLLAACCLNPAGPGALWASIRILVPQIADSPDVLRLSGWHPWWEQVATAEGMAFLILTAVCLRDLFSSSSRQAWAVPVVAHMLAAASSENLPLAAIGMALQAKTSPLSPINIDPVTTRISVGPSRAWPALVQVGLLTGLCVLAAQPRNHSECGLGWGLDPRLDPDAFAFSLTQGHPQGNAHCVGMREAGLLAWHAPPGLKPYDSPRTAFLNQRLPSHVLLTRDLAEGRRIAFPRAQSDEGGWWSILKERGTSTLVVPSERVDLISALEPTLWKPLSLNAVSLVYGKAGDPTCSLAIVQILSERQGFDRGSWTCDSSTDIPWHTLEFPVVSGEDATTRSRLRQARVFRAMGMSIGALKVLRSLPNFSQPAVRTEFCENQMQLGYRERILCGRSSELRLRASKLCTEPPFNSTALSRILNGSADSPLSSDPAFTRAVAAYVQGDLPQALLAFPDDSAEGLYARACLSLEAGDVPTTARLLQDFLTRFPSHRLALAARPLLNSLAR